MAVYFDGNKFGERRRATWLGSYFLTEESELPASPGILALTEPADPYGDAVTLALLFPSRVEGIPVMDTLSATEDPRSGNRCLWPTAFGAAYWSTGWDMGVITVDAWLVPAVQVSVDVSAAPPGKVWIWFNGVNTGGLDARRLYPGPVVVTGVVVVEYRRGAGELHAEAYAAIWQFLPGDRFGLGEGVVYEADAYGVGAGWIVNRLISVSVD